MRVPSCSSVSSGRNESLAGTASLVKRWLLVEDPGPWGYDALTQNRLPKDLLRELRSWAESVSARMVLIRRGPRKRGAARKIFVASSQRGNEWLASLTTDDLATLTATDRGAFAAGSSFPGRRIDELYLVCTHGRHDRCCSVRGNPVARALCAKYGDTAWECSHIGGDRFAANIVCLPHGAYFGRVAAPAAEVLTEDYGRGVLDLDRFRGWSSLPFAAQAAEIATRRSLGIDRIDELSTKRWEKKADTEVAVEIATTSFGTIDVMVTIGRSEDGYYLTCKAEQPGRPPLFEIDGVPV
ncbi:MAG: sucrase ferredoxin [Actinobacteria bacterium]|nr:sucrase ferredoxin [Actinomycetota bacterium]